MIGFPVLTSADSDLLPIANGTFTTHGLEPVKLKRDYRGPPNLVRKEKPENFGFLFSTAKHHACYKKTDIIGQCPTRKDLAVWGAVRILNSTAK